MKRNIKIYDINWDTDNRKNTKLPKELDIDLNDVLDDDMIVEDIDSEKLGELLCDYLSDEYGYCIFNFKFA